MRHGVNKFNFVPNVFTAMPAFFTRVLALKQGKLRRYDWGFRAVWTSETASVNPFVMQLCVLKLESKASVHDGSRSRNEERVSFQ